MYWFHIWVVQCIEIPTRSKSLLFKNQLLKLGCSSCSQPNAVYHRQVGILSDNWPPRVMIPWPHGYMFFLTVQCMLIGSIQCLMFGHTQKKCCFDPGGVKSSSRACSISPSDPRQIKKHCRMCQPKFQISTAPLTCRHWESACLFWQLKAACLIINFAWHAALTRLTHDLHINTIRIMVATMPREGRWPKICRWQQLLQQPDNLQNPARDHERFQCAGSTGKGRLQVPKAKSSKHESFRCLHDLEDHVFCS